MFENIQRIPDVVMVENDPAQPDEMKAGCFRYKDVTNKQFSFSNLRIT